MPISHKTHCTILSCITYVYYVILIIDLIISYCFTANYTICFPKSSVLLEMEILIFLVLDDIQVQFINFKICIVNCRSLWRILALVKTHEKDTHLVLITVYFLYLIEINISYKYIMNNYNFSAREFINNF